MATLALSVAVFMLTPLAEAQQSGQDWFIPGQSRAPATGAPAGRPPRTAAAPAAASQPSPGPEEQQAEEAAPIPQDQLQAQLPPAPSVPDVARGSMPPASVIGVLSIPDILRNSIAYQAADKVVSERRQKLNEDAQKEQTQLRDLGQQLANERAKLSPEQVRSKEKELQDRIAESRRGFTERNRIIQEQGQYALLQIQRTLSEVVQKVASSRGMNLVLQRAEVAVNIPEFDITPQVTDVLNKALPSVVIPPEGVSPLKDNAVASAADAAKKPATAAKKP